jgi:hypothetical protein
MIAMAHMFMPLYNVDAPVGPSQPNASDDVRLVQRLLALWGSVAPSQVVGLQPLVANGTYSENLGTWIRTFQQSAPATVAKDGKIDPIRGRHGHFMTNIGSHTSTLLVLNFNCMTRNALAHYRLAENLHLVIRVHLT